MSDMNFQRMTIGSLFNDNKNLAVPTYQRGYAWTNLEWEDFWNDLTEVIEENEDDHFLGQVVTNELDGKQYIVDGQQRVTTSTIFLAVLRDVFAKIDDPTAIVRARDIQKKFIGAPGKYSFTQNALVSDYFQKLIQVQGNFESVRSRANQESERNFNKAYEYLHRRLSTEVKNYNTVSERIDYLEDIYEAFLDHMFIMKISTPDEASAFVIFETLNARGRDLNSSDLLKNHLFRKANGDSDIQQNWDAMMQPLDFDSTSATRFIRSYWNGTHEFVTEKKLYRALNRSISSKSDAERFVRKLADLSDEFQSMVDPKNQVSFKDETLINNLLILNLLGAKTFYPLVLVLVEHNFSESDITKVLYKIISFTIRNFTIGGLVANKYEKSFANIARELSDGKISSVLEINALISEQMISNEEFSDDVKFATASTEKVAKYLLSELAYEQDSNKIDLNDVRVIYLNENVDNKDRLGNKILITKDEFKEIKKSANRKEAVIRNAKFTVTRELAELVNSITSDQIDARQAQWKNNAVNIWIK